MTIVRIGCGAGFADDRSDAAVPIVAELARREGPRFLIFETLAERTLALAQIARRRDPDAGAGDGVERFLRPVLADCLKHGIRIVSNFGWRPNWAIPISASPWSRATMSGTVSARPNWPRVS